MKTILSKDGILDRIKEGCNLKNDADLARFLGIARTTLSNWRSRNSIDYDLVFSKCEHMDLNWLLTGERIFYPEGASDVVVSNDFRLRTDRTQDSQRVPLYDLEAAASFISLFNENGIEPIDYLVIPDLPPCDGAMYVRGDSMYPLLKSGDIALYRRITDYQFGILWGEIHIVSYESDGEQYVLIKYVQKSDIDKCIRLVSYNQHHSSQDIPFEKVRAIALVKASVRYNTLG